MVQVRDNESYSYNGSGHGEMWMDYGDILVMHWNGGRVSGAFQREKPGRPVERTDLETSLAYADVQMSKNRQ